MIKRSNNRPFRLSAGAALLAALLALGGFSANAIAAPGGGGSGFSPSAGAEIDPAQSYRDGLEALEAGDYRKAEKKFGEVLQVSRDNPEANYYMGLAKIGRNKIKSSVRYFERAVKERPDFVEARERLALVLIELDKHEDAMEHATALRAQRTACDESNCSDELKARLDQAINAVDAAAKNQSASVATDIKITRGPSDRVETGTRRYLVAVGMINEQQYGAAIEMLFETQRLVGPHPDILNYLGYSHRKLGKFDKAQTYYARALALDPYHLGANEYLGELYLELGDLKRAKAQLTKLDVLCTFGCAEREDLARLIDIREAARTARR